MREYLAIRQLGPAYRSNCDLSSLSAAAKIQATITKQPKLFLDSKLIKSFLSSTVVLTSTHSARLENYEFSTPVCFFSACSQSFERLTPVINLPAWLYANALHQ